MKSGSNLKAIIILAIYFFISGCDHKVGKTKSSQSRPHKKEIARVLYTLSACFAADKCELIISRQDSNYLATLKRFGKKDITQKLSAQQIADTDTFLTRLKAVNSKGYCTTLETYTVAYKENVFKKDIVGCDFDSFYFLLRKLNLED